MAIKEDALNKAAHILKEADAILVGAGAGMSIPAGIDLTDREAFAQNFPAMVSYGFEYAYQLVGYPYEDERLRWGYLSASLMKSARLGIDPTYQKLKKLLGEKDYFILTSNVDRLFHKNGFDEDHIYTPQGDSFKLQCKTPCSNEVWDALPIFAEAEKHIDPQTQYLTSMAYVPKCPNCGQEVYMNVRSGMFYIDEPYRVQQEALNAWLESKLSQKVVLLEIGVGYNTPGVIRHPFERLAQSASNISHIRINKYEADGPKGTLSIQNDITETLTQLSNIQESTQ